MKNCVDIEISEFVSKKLKRNFFTDQEERKHGELNKDFDILDIYDIRKCFYFTSNFLLQFVKNSSNLSLYKRK
ncbi:unnamed protein product [Trichobilharzia szidati]|nr:unnamed protein product [Trichobilharzia szidati]